MDPLNEWLTMILLPGLCLPVLIAGMFMLLQPQKYDLSVLFRKKKYLRRKRKPAGQVHP